MRSQARILILGFLLALGAVPACQAQGAAQGAFWVAGELGYGSATVNSAVAAHSKGGLALGFEGGYVFTPMFSLGLRLSGCTLATSNLNDPSKGESLSFVSMTARVNPLPGQGVFLRGGIGSMRYTNNRPLEWGGSGTGLSLGAGYEFPLRKRLRVAPVLDLTWSKLDDVDNAVTTIRNRRCKFLSFGINLSFS